jgi:hypothetical protein
MQMTYIVVILLYLENNDKENCLSISVYPYLLQIQFFQIFSNYDWKYIDVESTNFPPKKKTILFKSLCFLICQ